jgi:cation diffusion facilitator family transporter
MTTDAHLFDEAEHQHVFLGSGHSANERKAWAVIALCSTMMLIEIGGGIAFGSLALVADGLHMSTHAIAMLIAALAYTFARKHASDRRFSFGTGKVGDLAGFSSAIVLALIALLIGYEAVARLLAPVAISFREAIPIAFLGLIVNVVSAWLLGGGDDHYHDRGHAHDHAVQGADRDHNLRAAFIHVAADAVVSILAILGLTAARYLGWLWMDPMMGIVGALVISLWAYALVRDTGRILLDMTPDSALLNRIRRRLEADGDRIADLHLWRLGPGHLGAILAIVTLRARDTCFYRSLLKSFPSLSHVTVEVINCVPSATSPATVDPPVGSSVYHGRHAHTQPDDSGGISGFAD